MSRQGTYCLGCLGVQSRPSIYVTISKNKDFTEFPPLTTGYSDSDRKFDAKALTDNWLRLGCSSEWISRNIVYIHSVKKYCSMLESTDWLGTFPAPQCCSPPLFGPYLLSAHIVWVLRDSVDFAAFRTLRCHTQGLPSLQRHSFAPRDWHPLLITISTLRTCKSSSTACFATLHPIHNTRLSYPMLSVTYYA